MIDEVTPLPRAALKSARRGDEAEQMAIIFAAFHEGIAICMVRAHPVLGGSLGENDRRKAAGLTRNLCLNAS